MNTNKVTAIGVSIIAIGVVAAGITYGVKENDKNKKINAKSECMGRGSEYARNMKYALQGLSGYLQKAERALDECLAERGLQLIR